MNGLDALYWEKKEKEGLEKNWCGYSNIKEDFEIYKEMKMKERIEMPSKERIRAVARKWASKCPNAKQVIEDLFPEAFEEKEIELKDGQIYKYNNKFAPDDQHFLLKYNTEGKWDLVCLTTYGHWARNDTKEKMKYYIKSNFTLCSHATITVKEEWNPLSPTSVRYDDC